MIKLPEKLPIISDIASKIENDLDFDFKADKCHINSVEEFKHFILEPYYNNERIYFRGESVISDTRPLLPSIFRNRNDLLDDELIRIIGCEEIVDYYKSKPKYIDFYENTIGEINSNDLYQFLAFSQHYFGVSPFLDLTKNPFVSLSFSLKNRTEYNSDVLFYTVEIKNEKDYTNDINVANKWLKDYTVILISEANKRSIDAFKFEFDNYKEIHNEVKGRSVIDLTAPCAKLIDLPTNDLMKYQQGVFLLLDDFTLVGNGYLTKKIRDDFSVKKYIINKNICPQLLELLNNEHPYYNYNSITNLSTLVKRLK